MNWSSVKNLLIGILVAANLFLIFNIVRQYRTRNYISDEEIAGAVELLAGRGLVVPKSGIPEKRFKGAVYESLYSDEYYTNAAASLTVSERELLISLPDGGFSITSKNGETVEFGTEFSFSYSKYDTFEDVAYTDITAENFARYKENGDAIGGAKYESLVRKAEKFLNSGVPADYMLSADVSGGYYDKENNSYILLARQYLNGYPVYSNYAVCVFSRDELIFAAGRWYFAPLDEDYSTTLRDQINILFEDLSALRAEYASTSTVDGDTENETVPEFDENTKIPAIKAVSPCYAIYWNGDKTALYFIPAWQVEHIDGLTIVYNAANGTMYLKDS